MAADDDVEKSFADIETLKRWADEMEAGNDAPWGDRVVYAGCCVLNGQHPDLLREIASDFERNLGSDLLYGDDAPAPPDGSRRWSLGLGP